jgi:tRNA(fMet)-specific endonuclease VapC
MSGSLLDTNVIIKLLNGDGETVKFLDNTNGIFYIPCITVGELYYGANKSKQKNNNIRLFNEFVSEYPILDINKNTAEVYGIVKHNLLKIGFTIPENDLWIASIAIENGLVLISYDKHFMNIENLRLLI